VFQSTAVNEILDSHYEGLAGHLIGLVITIEIV